MIGVSNTYMYCSMCICTLWAAWVSLSAASSFLELLQLVVRLLRAAWCAFAWVQPMAITAKYSFEGNVITFDGTPLKIHAFQEDPGALWFQAKPIHSLLGATKLGHSLGRVHKEDKAALKDLIKAKGMPISAGSSDSASPTSDSFGHNESKAIYVNESGLYTLIMGSKMKGAQEFQRWVTKDVLPMIRRSGRYELPKHDGTEHYADKVTSQAGQTALSDPMAASAIAEALKGPMLEVVRAELQRSHPWDFHRRERHDNPLVEVGVMLDGDALLELDEDEHIIRLTDFLKERVSKDAWLRYGNKFKNIFAIELKKQKQQCCKDLEQPLYITKVQGEHRIVYTEADDDLMKNVFHKCKRRFQGINTRDEALLKRRRKQRRLEDYFLAGDDNHGSNAKEGKVGSSSATPSRPASSSDVVVLHREAVAQAPANIRLRAKRGDAQVHITDF